MQYSYELRDRVLSSAPSVLLEMEEVLSGHVFQDKGDGPIEKGFEICYFMPAPLVGEVMKTPAEALVKFRESLLKNKQIPLNTTIKIYDKRFMITPILTLEGSKCKFFTMELPC